MPLKIIVKKTDKRDVMLYRRMIQTGVLCRMYVLVFNLFDFLTFLFFVLFLTKKTRGALGGKFFDNSIQRPL